MRGELERSHGGRALVGNDEQGHRATPLSGAQLELLRRHVILHEYGHILLMHGGCELTLGNAFAHIGGSRRIKTLLGRSATWTAQEIAAENAATRLAARLTQQVDPLLEAF